MKPESIQRLISLKHKHEKTGATMDAMRRRFDRLASRHEDGTAPQAITAFNLFQTPEPIAARMAAMVAEHVHPGDRILEPSAGLGRLYKALRMAVPESCRVVMVENAPDCGRELYRIAGDTPGDRLFRRDFMELDFGDLEGTFQAVCMNPPFKMGTDIKHILHAFDMLAPGGLLVGLCYNGVKQNAILRGLTTTWEVLPEGSFKASGTGASVVILTMKRTLRA